MKLNIPDNAWPEWATYAARDADGSIWFYEEKPEMLDFSFSKRIGSTKKMELYMMPEHEWEYSLTTRQGVADET